MNELKRKALRLVFAAIFVGPFFTNAQADASNEDLLNASYYLYTSDYYLQAASYLSIWAALYGYSGYCSDAINYANLAQQHAYYAYSLTESDYSEEPYDENALSAYYYAYYSYLYMYNVYYLLSYACSFDYKYIADAAANVFHADDANIIALKSTIFALW